MKLSRADTCRERGRAAAGEDAWWAWGSRRVVCLGCRPLEAEVVAIHAASASDAPRPDTTVATEESAVPAADPRAAIDRGTAGGSAMREYERRHAQRETRVRERWGRLGPLVLTLTSDPQTIQAWQRGSIGESKLAAALGKLDREDVIFLHDRRVPSSRGNIDHIVAAPTGVYVVDAKRVSGEVRVRDVAGLFSRPDRRLFAGRRDCSAFARNMSWQVDTVRAALGGREDVPIIPVLCFVDADWPLFGRPDGFEGVRIEEPSSLRRAVSRSGPLTTDEIVELATVLSHALPAK